MEVEAYIHKVKELYSSISNFLQSEGDSQIEFCELTEVIDNQKIVQNRDSFLELIQFLYNLGDNHQRTENLLNKLGLILQYLNKEPLPISYEDFFNIYKSNKFLLLLLFEKKVLQPIPSILKLLKESKDFNDQKLSYYLFSEIKNSINDEERKNLEKEIKQLFNEDIETFEMKCKLGENDSYLCSLIRQDLIQDFVSYVNRTNLPLNITIKADYYESNTFLINKEPSLIEYASFYGSIQIIQYLRLNKAKNLPGIWPYIIHSNNAELICFLEENEIYPEDKTYKGCLEESIKCYHNDISDYIIENLLRKTKSECSKIVSEFVVKYHNYYFYPDDINDLIISPDGFYLYHFASSFKNITIPDFITKIGINSFKNCSSLTQITIPSSITSIGKSAFSGCSSLTQIIIPSSITEIGDYTFYKCSSLTQITIPSSITSIGNSAFSECSSLTQIIIPSSVTKIGSFAFSRCSSLTQIIIPSITEIGYSTFLGCSSLTQITIPSSVTKIGNYAFSECSSITQIIIPSSVVSIGSNTFSKCSSLTQITIPSSVTKIGNYVFYQCFLLTKITIPSSLSTSKLGLPPKIKIIYT